MFSLFFQICSRDIGNAPLKSLQCWIFKQKKEQVSGSIVEASDEFTEGDTALHWRGHSHRCSDNTAPTLSRRQLR